MNITLKHISATFDCEGVRDLTHKELAKTIKAHLATLGLNPGKAVLCKVEQPRFAGEEIGSPFAIEFLAAQDDNTSLGHLNLITGVLQLTKRVYGLTVPHDRRGCTLEFIEE